MASTPVQIMRRGQWAAQIILILVQHDFKLVNSKGVKIFKICVPMQQSSALLYLSVF